MANNIDVIGDAATVSQIITYDFSATNGVIEDDTISELRLYVFYGCTTLTKALFKNLTSAHVDGDQFGRCSNLVIADMGTLGNVRKLMFELCSSLACIILRKTSSVCYLDAVSAFNSTKYAANGAGGAYVYVPRALISTYQSATNWATLYAAHNDMFRALEDYTVDGTTTGDFDESKL